MKKNKVSKIGLMISAVMAVVGFGSVIACGSIVGVIAAPAIERMWI